MTTFAGHALEQVDGDEEEVAQTAFDLQLVQKVLPKFNGGRELELPLSHLLAFCLDGSPRKTVDPAGVLDEARKRLAAEAFPASSAADAPTTEAGDEPPAGATGDESTESAAPAPAIYPRASRALARMLMRLRVSGFVAFLE